MTALVSGLLRELTNLHFRLALPRLPKGGRGRALLNDLALLRTDHERAATPRPAPDRGQQLHVRALDGLRLLRVLAVFVYHALQANRIVG
jgi:hypothetical protein